MDKCYEIEKYKEQLSKVTNESNLSLGMIKYIIHDLCNYIDNLYQQNLEQEQQNILEEQFNDTISIKEEENENEQQTFTSAD